MCFDSVKIVDKTTAPTKFDDSNGVFSTPTYPDLTVPCEPPYTPVTRQISAGVGTINEIYDRARGTDTLQLAAGDYEIADTYNPNAYT